MHTINKRIILVINVTPMQASTKLTDWRSVIPYLLWLRSSVARLPSCLAAKTRPLVGTYEHLRVLVGTGYSRPRWPLEK